MKSFNTTAVCVPSKHSMVDLTERVKEIKKLVDAGKYFTINRARQYGKTTTITALAPFDIAADFDIDMSLSEDGIRGMLDEYEADHHTGMDTAAIAGIIRDYTDGYPFLVSRICQLLDESVSKNMSISDAWTIIGVDEAVKQLLAENNTLFQPITKNLNNYPELKAAIKGILMEGTRLTEIRIRMILRKCRCTA